MTVEITEHAKERARERLSWNAETLQKMAQRAFDLGFKPKDLKAAIKRYVDLKGMQYHSTTYVYGEVMYVFRQLQLITVYLIPNKMKGSLKKCKKT